MSAGTATGNPTFHTLADLRTMATTPTPERKKVYVRENRGFFYWDGTSSETDNNDSVVTPADRSSSGGRWVRPTGALTGIWSLESLIYLSGTPTLQAPAEFMSPSLQRNKARIQCWASGGGGVTNTGAGGGGEYRENPEYPLVPGNTYNWSIAAASAPATAGTQTTFDATGVVANPGASGTTGAGGSGGTGTIGFNGASVTPAVGTQAGGGGAGSEAAGSGATGGANEGGSGVGGAAGRALSCGGGSSAGGQSGGARGEGRASYFIPGLAGFARRMESEVRRDSSAVNSRTPDMPANIGAGDLLVMIVDVDCAGSAFDVTLSGGGTWLQDAGASGTIRDATNAVGKAVYYKIAVGGGADTPLVETRVAGALTATQANTLVTRYEDAGTPLVATAHGSSANANPPAASISGSAKWLFHISAALDAAQTNFTSFPASYTGQSAIYPASDTGVISVGAHRYFETASEDPAAFGSGNEQWVAATIAIPFSGA